MGGDGHYTDSMTIAAASNAVIPLSPVSVEDAELVDRFVSTHDSEAFAELVRRYSDLVYGVGSRVLRNSHDMDDMFQATFLVLVRDAVRVRQRQSIASWIYGVAHRTALRVARQRQRRRETMLVDDLFLDDQTFHDLAERHDLQLVDVELQALPEKYRQPLVLRYLMGKSPSEIARELNLTLGAVEGMLKRGRDELRSRLMQRGVTLGVALVAVQLSQQAASAAQTLPLIDGAIQTGLAWNPGSNSPISDLISNRVLELSEKEVATMTTLTNSSLAVGLTIGILVLGLGGAALITPPPGGRLEAGVIPTLHTNVAAAQTAEAAILVQDAASLPDDSESKSESNGTIAAANSPLGKENESPREGSAKLQAIESGTGTVPNTPTEPTTNGQPDNPPVQKPFFGVEPTNREIEARIERSLLDSTEVAFTDTPLEEALDYLEDVHHLQFWVDNKALQDEEISIKSQVSLVISGISLKSVLHLILEPHGLDFYIKDQVLVITTEAKSQQIMETRIYDVTRLCNIKSAVFSADGLAEMIQETIEPNHWRTRSQLMKAKLKAGAALNPGGGGVGNGNTDADPGSLYAADNLLIIRQNRRTHEKIADLIEKLEQAIPKPTATR
jgi:RNA polymerase sigma factor (sigma-70 family)